jgi:hypothetical protein
MDMMRSWVEKGCNVCGAAGLWGFLGPRVWLCFGLFYSVRFIPLSDLFSLCIYELERYFQI